MFLSLPNRGSGNSDVTTCGFDVLRCRSGWPLGKVLLVEGREESAECFGVVVSFVDVILLREPFLLVEGTC